MSLAKSIEWLGLQAEKQQQQQQLLLKHMEGMLKEKMMNEAAEGSSSTGKIVGSLIDPSNSAENEGKTEDKIMKLEGDESASDRSKFKKVEIPVFIGTDLDSWLFWAELYFQIHKLIELEKMIVAVISFDGAALDWYQSHED